MSADLCLVLHAHLPFIRHPQPGVFLEENWLPEAVLECYIPLLRMLDRLESANIPGQITFTVTPTLGAMLSDSLLQRRVQERLDKLCALVEKEAVKHAADAFRPAVEHYSERFHSARDYFVAADRDLLARFRHHFSAGRIEIITCAATHALLPLLTDPAAIARQIAIGTRAFKEFFGQTPQGIWLPECAYFPEAGAILRDNGLRYTILAAHAFLYAAPRPAAGVYAPVRTPEGLCVFGRDPQSSEQVWSGTLGYPGDGTYREFYRDYGWDGELNEVAEFFSVPGVRHDLGLKYYRVTGRDIPAKEIYQPAAAAARAAEHAEDFLRKRMEQISRLTAAGIAAPVITAPYDAELFGHWWYEGPLFLENLLRRAAEEFSPVRCVTPPAVLERPAQTVRPAVSSWGNQGYFSTWLNGDTDWIFPRLFAAQERFNRLCDRPAGNLFARRVQEQATRELLLAQSSDWPFIITNHTMMDYARNRVNDHLTALNRLLTLLENGTQDLAYLQMREENAALFSNGVIMPPDGTRP